MNTDKLVPIDFSRKITPVVAVDNIYNALSGDNFNVAASSVARLNKQDRQDSNRFIVSYADRVNTGNQPVADDVVVDCYVISGGKLTGDACHFIWENNNKIGCVVSWKLNHTAMVERYQATLADKEDERMNNIARNGNDGDHYDVNPELAASMVAPVGKVESGLIVSKQELSVIQTLKSFGYKYVDGVWSQQEVKPELAAYMVPHVMDSSIKRLGVFLRKNELVNEGEGVIDCVIRELAEKHDIDMRTDEDKLLDAMVDVIGRPDSLDSLGFLEDDLNKLIASPLITITLKGK